jgi:hypothetical protein
MIVLFLTIFVKNPRMPFLALFISLPTKSSTARMRVWRALKSLGCATLRDGVYLLPDRPEHASVFDAVVTETLAAAGQAEVYRLAGLDEAREAVLRGLFDRSADYAELFGEIDRLLGRLRCEAAADLIKPMRHLRRRFDEIVASDHFPGPVQAHARQAVEDLEASLAERLSPDEPRHIQGRIVSLKPTDYHGRIWATRRDLWVDRIASAWLIRRHIDRKASFLWLAKPDDCPEGALGFDFDGATFTHVGHRVTFETLLAAFGLENEAGLRRLGGLVHALDVGGATPPEAAGLSSLLRGIKFQSRDDDDFLKRATPVFDAFHASFNEEQQ